MPRRCHLVRATLVGFLLAAALVACDAPAETPPPETSPREPGFVERLDADVLLVESLRRALEAEPQTVEAWLRELPDPGGRWNGEREHDVGFGARRFVVRLAGGHTSAEVALLSADGAVARVSVLQYPRGDASWPDVSPALARAWGRGKPTSFRARVGHEDVAVEREDAALLAELDARRTRELGVARPESPPGELDEAYRTLLDPLSELMVGTSFGIDGSPPPGHDESHALVAAGRFDLLRCVLRGPNPEARVYAAHALLESGNASAADAAAIEALARLSVQLTTCGGCMVGAGDWKNALEQLRRP